MVRYKTPRALEMAVKQAAKLSPLGVARGIDGFYRDRLLVRIFDDEESTFVLKGGQGLLARTIKARESRDIDIATHGRSIEEAIAELRRLAQRSLDDYLVFEMADSRPIKISDGYRDGVRVSFVPILGGTKRLNRISIDVVADQIACGEPDLVKPENRLPLDGLKTVDYRVVPVVQHLADKICACAQGFEGGRSSSRIRDLVDIVIFAHTEEVAADDLRIRVATERALRKMPPLDKLFIPQDWLSEKGRKAFKVQMLQTQLSDQWLDIGASIRLADRLVTPAISELALGCTWSPATMGWE